MSLIETALAKLRLSEASGEVHKNLGKQPNISATGLSVSASPSLGAEPHIVKRIHIDAAALRAAGYLPEESMERQFADHYRQVKRPLIEKALAGAADMRLILVSSALPGDGKTFTSLNLALSIARERDVSVLLVDADGPRARISEILGIRREPGLLDALSDESLDVESLVQYTDIRGLEVLPAGNFIENATELLASARMSQVGARLSARNARRLIVMDSAPLLVSNEARVLTRIPGQIILVVRAGATPRRAIFDAIDRIDKQKLQGLVVNEARTSSIGGYYGYSTYESGSDNRSTTA